MGLCVAMTRDIIRPGKSSRNMGGGGERFTAE